MPTLNVEAPPQRVVYETASSARAASFFTAPGSLLRAALLLGMSLLAIAINGYHPYSEDAGIYVAGIKQAANPALYGDSAIFVTASSHLSRFCYLNALLARSLHLSLDLQLCVLQVLTTWLLLAACWRLSQLCFQANGTRWAAVLVVAVCLSVPVAGSSLFMMDPYVTGRSFSTPLTLLAIAACLDGKLARCGLLLVLVGLFHPLMFLYGAAFVLLLYAVTQRSWVGTVALMLCGIAAAGAVDLTQRGVVESAAYRAAVATRPYFFLAYWRWYELVGLAAPLLLLGLFVWWQRHRPAGSAIATSATMLATACTAFGLCSLAVSLLFVRPDEHSDLVAAMQPARAFVLIYLCMFLLLGGLLGEYVLQRVAWRWAVLIAVLAPGIAVAQKLSYPASRHLELPFVVNQNGWNRAFLWIRDNTPWNAVVALDAQYIHAPGEDAQGFRAIAERAALADASKDGGAAAVFPQLAERWQVEHLADTGLNTISDFERQRRLRPFHATWIVLDREAPTAMPCPFEDDLVKVCRIP